jgi:hypothetical protein
MHEIGIDVLFSLVPQRELANVWTEDRLPGVEKLTTLAGYVSEAALRYPAQPLEARPVDVGYRGRTLPYWIGIIGQEKAWIAQEFARRCDAAGLRCDLGWRESDRIYGRSWFDFIASCRVTLGTESGATITDFDSSLEHRTDEYIRDHPDADFWEVHREILEPYEGNVRMNIVSPRIFEAIALRTGLVLFPGEYSGVVEPEKHYIPLEKDFSNFDAVVAAIRDTASLKAMVDRAYQDVIASGRYAYERLVEQFDSILDERVERRAAGRFTGAALAEARARRVVRRTLEKQRHGALARGLGAATVVAEDPEMRALARAWARSYELRREVSPRRLAKDLVRLAVLRRAQAGRLAAGTAFAVEPELRNGNEVLVLRSRERRDDNVADAAVSPLELKRVRAIVWDHSAVREAMHPVTSWWWGRIPIGSRDIYEFAELPTVAAYDETLVSHALEPVLSPPLPQDPIPPKPDDPPLPLRVLRHPGDYAPKLLLMLGVSRDTPLRRVLAASFRAEGAPRLVLRDVIRLEILRRMIGGGLAEAEGVAVETVWDSADGALTLTTRPSAASERTGSRIEPTGVRRIIWDHSALTDRIRLKRPRLEISLDPRGFHEFEGLERLMSTAPHDVVAAIDYVLEPLGR